MVLEKKIKELVELDEELRAKIEQAHQAKVDSKQKIVSDKKNIANATWDQVKKRVDEEKIKLDEYIKSAAIDNQEEYQQTSERLKRTFEDNKEKWIAELVDNSLKI
ncbi:MAG: hypothetical protein PHG99_06200 [Erysipelotrichaceae bacterium]|nr:hypothetical protein [Erysipelotrichaceae bacterium]MDD4643067.1 hypothetical protein [Erysipelotrichaceae bacterium]